MANQIVFNVSPDFNIQMFAQQLAEKYRMEGFAVTVAEFNGSEIINLIKRPAGSIRFSVSVRGSRLPAW